MRPEGVLKRGLEEGIKGSHVRGARALLDWSMSDLARASKLSLSTIRRLEEDGLGEAARSLPRARAGRRQAGLAVLRGEGGGLALGRAGRRRGPPPPPPAPRRVPAKPSGSASVTHLRDGVGRSSRRLG